MTIAIRFLCADSINNEEFILRYSFFFDDGPAKCKGLESSRKKSINIGQAAAMFQEYRVSLHAYISMRYTL